jgi:ATP-dependent Clp protease ATP-binding subunit ClpC
MSSQSHRQGRKQAPADFALRVVHTPAPTPALGNLSRSSSRGLKKIDARHHIPRAAATATIDGFTMGESFNIVSLAHGVFQFQGLSAGFDSLVQRVMGLFALAEHQIWRLGWLTSFINKESSLAGSGKY